MFERLRHCLIKVFHRLNSFFRLKSKVHYFFLYINFKFVTIGHEVSPALDFMKRHRFDLGQR